MKRVLSLLLFFALTPAFASARDVTCTDTTTTFASYHAVISDSSAKLYYGARPIAGLSLTQVKRPPAGSANMPIVYKYIQRSVNGYRIEYTTGMFAGRATATAIVLRGGVAGFTPIATLNMCQ